MSVLDDILDKEQFVLSRAEIRRVMAKWIVNMKETPTDFDAVQPDISTDENYADRQAEYFLRIHKGEE